MASGGVLGWGVPWESSMLPKATSKEKNTKVKSKPDDRSNNIKCKTSSPETERFFDVEFRWVFDHIMNHVPKNKNSQTLKHHTIKPDIGP